MGAKTRKSAREAGELAKAKAVVSAAEEEERVARSTEVPMDHGNEEEDEGDRGDVSGENEVGESTL